MTFADQSDLLSLCSEKTNSYVVVTNTHNQYLALKDKEYRKIHKESLINLSDSNILKYSAHFLGKKITKNVMFGADLVKNICSFSIKNKFKVGFYGSDPETLLLLNDTLKNEFEGLEITFVESPPFRDLSEKEENDYINQINSSEVDILFVGLGCPKQEKWMHKNSKQINSLMFGVGAAFEYIAKKDNKMSRYHAMGFGWLYRLVVDPKRLMQRYFIDGSKFIFYLIKQRLKNVQK